MASTPEPEMPNATPHRSLLDRLDEPRAAPAPGRQTVTLSAADVRAIFSSPALGAFLHRRIEQLAKNGHGPASDLELPMFKLPRKAQDYLIDALDYIGHGNDDYINPERLELALTKLEIAGALLLSAHDRLRAAQKEKPAAMVGGGLGGGNAETSDQANGSTIC